jgi:hypothetical protein
MPATTGSYALRTTLTLVVLFWFAPVTAAAPRYQVLHAFTNGNDGADPAGSLTLDQQGNVYGATVAGTIFELSPQPTGPWIFQVIFTFNGVDGSTPNGGMVLDAVGNLYGKTLLCCPYPYGEAFELSPGSEGWTENTIYNFGDPVGASPGGSS